MSNFGMKIQNTGGASEVSRISASSMAVQTVGEHETYVYPRSTGREALLLPEGSRVVVNHTGRTVYLTLPPCFETPGPRYGSFIAAQFRYRIDEGPWTQIAIVDSPNQLVLGEGLDAGTHRVEIETVRHIVPIAEIIFSEEPVCGIRGILTSSSYTELLTDVRIDTFAGEQLLRTDTVRNPVSATFALLGLEPGTYRFRLTASGWSTHELGPIELTAGTPIGLGVIVLEPSRMFGTYAGPVAVSSPCGPGKTLSVIPGGSFSCQLASGIQRAELVSPYKCIELKIDACTPSGSQIDDRWRYVTFHVPTDTPHDMYALRLYYDHGIFHDANGSDSKRSIIHGCPAHPLELPQAVCVRDALPEQFFMAGMGHTNTWGQQSSEYLAKVAEMVQLAGARNFLIANEVNPAYISGALCNLRIPYLVAPGNHTMGRWDHFFGTHPFAVDDGPLRIVTFHDIPNRSWDGAMKLASEREDATNRVILAFEGFAPLNMIIENQLSLLFGGHSVEKHPFQDHFPAGAMRLRAPGSETVRWIPMTPHGIDPRYPNPDDIPVLHVPREGLFPPPLRVEYSLPNDGTADAISARIINEFEQSFPQARLRFVLRAREADSYLVSGGGCLQSFMSDDKTKSVLDVGVSVPARSEIIVDATSA
jgi:hypothetical protein